MNDIQAMKTELDRLRQAVSALEHKWRMQAIRREGDLFIGTIIVCAIVVGRAVLRP